MAAPASDSYVEVPIREMIGKGETRVRKRLIWLAFLWLCPACGPAVASDFPIRLEERIASALVGASEHRALSDLQRFYAERAFRPLWSGSPQAMRRAGLLLHALAHSDAEGLDPAAYGTADLERWRARTDLAARVEFEFRMSQALAAYARHVRTGRISPHYVRADLPFVSRGRSAYEILTEASKAADFAAWLAAQPPSNPRYRRLRALLSALRIRKEEGGWTVVPETRVLKPGMEGREIRLLRRRLMESGDLAVDEPLSGRFDDRLERAVRRFQMRHGLKADGIVGRQTLEELNRPIDDRIRQVVLNLERRRWLSFDLGQRYLFVNIADFSLKLVERPVPTAREHTLFTTEVVVGTRYRQTPVFSRPLRYVVLNPYWNVPRSIAVHEILPILRRDPAYLARMGMEVLSGWTADAKPLDPSTIDWKALSPRSFRYRFRQRPGPKNALGRIKFMLPNPYHVYLHDTPAKELFRHPVRTFSHGCIRVHEPLALGGMLLARQGWTEERLAAEIATGERRIIRLRDPLPVHITYVTAWVNRDGTAHFRKDIYGRDRRLLRLLFPSRGSAQDHARPTSVRGILTVFADSAPQPARR